MKPFVLVTQQDLEQRFPAVLCDPEFPNSSPSGPGAWFDLYDWLLSFGWIEALPVKKRSAGDVCNIEIWGVPGGPCDNIDPFPCLSEEQSDPYPGTDFTINLPGCCPEPVSSCVDEVGNGVKVDEWQCDELGGEFIEGKECEESPCTSICSIDQQGILDEVNSGWLPKDEGDGVQLARFLPQTFRFKIEQAENCGGQNPNQQTGTLDCSFTLAEESLVEFSVSGEVERQDAGYDYGRLTIAGVTAEISSFGENLGCEMTPRIDTKTVTLPAGDHTFNASVDTIDGLYHSSTTYTFSIKTSSNPLP